MYCEPSIPFKTHYLTNLVRKYLYPLVIDNSQFNDCNVILKKLTKVWLMIYIILGSFIFILIILFTSIILNFCIKIEKINKYPEDDQEVQQVLISRYSPERANVYLIYLENNRKVDREKREKQIDARKNCVEQVGQGDMIGAVKPQDITPLDATTRQVNQPNMIPVKQQQTPIPIKKLKMNEDDADDENLKYEVEKVRKRKRKFPIEQFFYENMNIDNLNNEYLNYHKPPACLNGFPLSTYHNYEFIFPLVPDELELYMKLLLAQYTSQNQSVEHSKMHKLNEKCRFKIKQKKIYKKALQVAYKALSDR